MSTFIQTLIDDAKKLVGDPESGHYPSARPADGDIDALLAYKPTSLADAVVHLQQLHDALGAVPASDTQTIGKILVAIGGVIEGFFPNWSAEGAFLVTIGTALISGGGTGTEGPIRLGNIGVTISWGPWGQQPAAGAPVSSTA